MSKLTYSLILAGLVSVPAASAFAADAAPVHTLTANVGLFSQYIYRGLTQTNEKAALQGGFDYAHNSGLYAGAWGSNVSWIGDIAPTPGLSSSLEIDTYFGYKGAINDDVSYDVGFLRYNYPGSYPAGFVKADTNEIYGQIGYKWFTAKYSYSLGDTFGVANARGTSYLDLSANFEIADKLTLGLHIGQQKFDGENNGVSNDSLYSYVDHKISLSKEINGVVLTAFYTNTDANAAGYTNQFGKNTGRSQFTVGVSKAF